MYQLDSDWFNLVIVFHRFSLDFNYRSGMVNSNTVNPKFHLI